MMLRLSQRSVPIYLLIFLFLTACGSGGPESGNTTPVNVSLKIPSKNLPSLASEKSQSFSPAPNSVSSVSLQVTNLSGLLLDLRDSVGNIVKTATADVTPGQIVTLDVVVPSGDQRIFIARGLDSNGNVLFQGQSDPVDLIPNVLTPVTIFVTDVSPTNFILTLLKSGLSGPVPAPNIRVFLNDPVTGNLIEDSTTNASGIADFGEIGTTRISFSILNQGSTSLEIDFNDLFTFMNVRSGSYTLMINTFDFNLPPLLTVDVNLTNLPTGTGFAELFTGGFQNEFSFPSNTVASFPGFEIDQIQSDLKYSLIGKAIDRTGGILGCGSLVDLDPDPINTFQSFSTPDNPIFIPFDASEPVIPLDINIFRKGVVFRQFQTSISNPITEGGFELCEISGAEGFEFRVGTFETPTLSSKTLSQISSTAPTNFNFNLPDLSIDTLSRDLSENVISWSQSGADLGKLDLALVNFLWEAANSDNNWELVLDPHSTTTLTLPTLPPDLANLLPPSTGVDVFLSLNGLDSVNGFDDFIQKTSNAGGDFNVFKVGATETVGVERSIPLTSTVTITLTGTTRTDIGGVLLSIDYDETLVSFSGASPLGIWSLDTANGVKIDGNQVTIGIIAPQGSPAGDFLELNFDNNGTGIPSGGTYPITSLKVTDINGQDITSQVGTSVSVTNQ
jgi:hypothetical protein